MRQKKGYLWEIREVSLIEEEDLSLIHIFLLFSAGLWYGWKVKSLFYLAIIPFAALMILLTTFISQSGLRDVQIFFYGGVIVITGTTLLIYIILHLKKQWYDTEA